MGTGNRLIQDIIISIQFLSRLSIPEKLAIHSKPDFSQSAWAFPVAGAIICLPATLVAVSTIWLNTPAAIAAVLMILTQAIVTGALHEDGLADIADGFGGGHDKERKLEIMKDSRVGAFGVVAIVLALLLRFAILHYLMEISVLKAVFVFISAQIFSRSTMVYFWQCLPPARLEGLSQSLGYPSTSATIWALGIGSIIAISLTLPVASPSSITAGFVMVAISLIAFRHLCMKQIQGQTGDTIGAMQMISEIAFLIGLTTFAS